MAKAYFQALNVLENTDLKDAIVFKKVFVDTNIPIDEVVSLILEKEIDSSEKLYFEMNSILSRHEAGKTKLV